MSQPASEAARHLVARVLAAEQAQVLVNGPLLRLPEELKLDENIRLLDIGCGRGALLRVLDGQLRTLHPPVGVDTSPAMLELALRDEADDGRPAAIRTRYATAYPTALPFRDGAFSLVTCGYTAHRLDGAAFDVLLREVLRVIEPGGLAVLWDYGPTGNPRLDAWNARVLALAEGTTPRLRSSRSLLEHAGAAGFPFVRYADLRPFLVPPIPRASVLLGKPPEGWTGPGAAPAQR